MDHNGVPVSLVKCERMEAQEVAWITGMLEKHVEPLLVGDVSSYAAGRKRAWMPYEAPLDSPGNKGRPFVPGVLNKEIWGWVKTKCEKHGFSPDTCLISKGGSIKAHRDTTYAAEWAFGINLGGCRWSIAKSRDSATDFYNMRLVGGEVFKFNCKFVHKVEEAAENRWSINAWKISDSYSAKENNVRGRLEQMLNSNPEVRKFLAQ